MLTGRMTHMLSPAKKIFRQPLLALAAACALLPAPTEAQAPKVRDGGGDALSQLLASAPGGSWIRVPNTRMASAIYNGPLAAAIHGNWGPPAIIGAWSGAALDTKNDRLIVW